MTYLADFRLTADVPPEVAAALASHRGYYYASQGGCYVGVAGPNLARIGVYNNGAVDVVADLESHQLLPGPALACGLLYFPIVASPNGRHGHYFVNFDRGTIESPPWLRSIVPDPGDQQITRIRIATDAIRVSGYKMNTYVIRDVSHEDPSIIECG